jgi:hypothetical protein
VALMKYTVLVESDTLLESKHKCTVDVDNLIDFKKSLIKDLNLNFKDDELLVELFDKEFEASVSCQNG